MTTSTSFAQMANNQSISLLSALRANTPPTKGQTPSRKFLTLSIFFLLSFFCTTNAWGAEKTITLTYTDFGLTTSYAQKIATVDGIGFTVNQGYKGEGNVIQMNSSKGSGILYNTTSIAGLKSIKVNVSSGSKSYTITSGTAQTPSGNSQTGTTTKTFSIPSGDTYFQLKVSGASYFSSIVITYDDGNSGGGGGGSGSGGCEWQLVTDASTLKAGDRVVIAAKDYNYAISTTQNTNNRGQAAITKSGNTIEELSSSVQVLTLETGKTSGSLAFNTGSGYLYAASSSKNYLKTETTLSANSSWTISIANSTATITAQGSNTNKVMQYNQSSSLFACYGSASQKALVLYKKVCTSSAPTTYTVTYDINDGTGSTPTKTNKAEGDEFNLAASTGFSKTGYRFMGWNDGTKTYEAGEQYTMPAENVTFTAQWAQEFTVKYDANGGTPTCTDNNKYIQGETVTVCANIPTKSDVTFAGWNDGTKTYEAGEQYTMPAENVTFTAQWKTIPKLATPSGLSATDINPTSATLNWKWLENTYAVQLSYYYLYIKKEGDANFTGPITYTSTSCSRTDLEPNTRYIWKVQAISKDKTIVLNSEESAEFSFTTAALPTYTVSFSTGTGNPTQADITELVGGQGITLPAGPTPACTDWTFAGWWTEAVAETTKAPTLLFKGDNYKPTADITLYAVYSKTETTQGSGTEATIIPNGLSNNTISHNQPSYTIITAKNTGQTEPAYVDNGADIRIYAKGSITISNTTNITKIVFNVSTQGKKRLAPITASVGSIATQASGDGTVTWTGEAKSVTFTVGDNAQYGTENTKAGQLCFTTITATTSGGGSTTTTTYNSNPECGPQQLETPNVELTYDCSSATITWDAVTNAKAYWYQIIKTGDTNSGISSTNTTYTRNDIEPGVSYTWSVKTIGDGSKFSDSEIATGTFTAYSIQWLANGELIENACGKAGEEIVVPTPNPASCDDTKEFVGWTATPIDGSIDTEPNDLFTTSPGNITGNATYHAVFATKSTGSGSAEYRLVTSINDFKDGTYTIAALSSSVYYFINGRYTEDGLGVETVGLQDSKISGNIFSETLLPSEAIEIEIEQCDEEGYYFLSYYDKEEDKWMSLDDNRTNKTLTWTDNDMVYVYRPVFDAKTYLISGSGAAVSQNGSTKTSFIRNYANGTVYNSLYFFKKISDRTPSSYSGYVTTCCKQPKTPLTIKADQIELVKGGVVTLTATGGNGTNITWTATGGVLSNQSNTGATLTISDVDATQNITVTATQAENNNDDEVVYCAQEASIDITVKAQWTITFWTNDDGNKESNSMTVTDGESYTMPDISDEYICTTGHSFVGWVDNEADKELDATPNSTQTATADQTWYAAWSSSSNTKSVDIYQLVTDVTNLTAGDKVWITNTTPTVAMGVQNENNRGQVTVTKHPTESDKIYSTGSPATLTIGKDGDYYTFHDGTGYLYAASSSKNYLRRQATNNANGKWSISIASGKATITAQGDNAHNKLKYNSGSSIFSCYESGQGDVRIYQNVGTAEIEVSGVSITTNNTSCHRGAVISAENGKWITSSIGQKVRIAINVTARGFNSDATLSATSANEHFSVVSITNTTITQNSAFETQMMIEYQPAEANTNENAEITLVAKKGEEVVATRTIDVNGRSLPDEFVIVAQYSDKWLALPANMQSGADQYNGIEVTPNNALTQIPAAPSTTIYSLRGVADNRYEAAGTCVRLVGNGNKCLWGNAAEANTTIQNWTTLGATNGKNYEWLLTTSDGELYTIANPEHPDYNQGRILSNSGSKYGLYKGTTKFYILPVGCSSQPGNIQVTARRVDATFSWEGNASSMKIDVYTNEAMTEGNISNTATASPYYMTGLSESTQYWFEMIPNGADDACAYTGSFKTTGPTIDVVEWQENAAVIFVDKDEELNPLVVIDGEVEHGVGGTKATDIFFSKYFEAQSEAKLLAIYNGTANAISLADITILQRGTNHSSTYVPLSLAPYGKTPGWIQPGEELILYNEDQSAYSEDIMKCAESDPTFSNWVKVDNNNLAFSGKGTVRLFRGDKCIDIIGAMGSAEDIHDKEVTPLEGTEKPSFGDKEGFTTATGDNYSTDDVETNYTLSTNRCLLVRKPSVTSGAIAVTNNIGDFKTLGNDYDGIANEWAGLQVPNGPSNDKYKYTCEGFQEVGSFDYNKYYKEYTNIDNDTCLKDYKHDEATKEYIITIKDLAKYSCLNLRFQLKQGDQVLTEKPVQVPIIVSGQKETNDAIFNAIVKTDASEPVYDQSIERCKTCNVVVLSNAKLTKAAKGEPNDVAEVANLKVYPGGQVIVPASTEYTVNSLAFRRQEDEVSMANIQGTLNVKHTNGVYLDVRIDPSNWHYMTLPYDCRVGDVTFADGTPAVVNTDYLLGWYDGAYRAEHKTGGWTYITDNDYILKKGLGYIVALPGDGKVRREIRFPMANSVIAEDLTSKTVSGLYAYGGDKTDAELRPNHKGWNMIGSPYLYTYTTDIVKEPLQMGTLEHSPVNPWDGTWVRTGDARYIVEPIDNGWSGYRQTTISNLKPFTSYFIQVGGKLANGEYTTITPETEQQIVFAANSIARNASAPRKAAEVEVTDNHPVWYGVEMIAPNNEKDNTTLLISNEFTDGYDMMDDLVKMRGDYYQYYNFPVLASNNNEGEMAFNALPDSSAAKIGVPLSYYAATAGTYTIATDGRFDLEEVKAAMLYDATTAQYTNLLTDNYSFTTNKGNNTNRFTLFVTVERKKVPNITTGMDNILANGQLSLIAVERTLVLSGLTENADIYVYDMSGKMVTGTHSAGENGIWRTIVPATGVYFVRVNSANSQQTLRTIVK